MAISKVLVVGGGITGTVLALSLANKGAKVTLVEHSPVWHGIGHGITLQGNALAAFKSVGIYEDLEKRGYAFNDFTIYTANGDVIMSMPTARTGGPDLPATVGALRTDLQELLCDKVYANSNIEVRLGSSVETYINIEGGVSVTFKDSTTETFELMVGCDGINSQIRDLMGITEKPKSIGMSIWRVVTGRPADMTCSGVYEGGPRYKAGYTPISETECYAFLLDEDLDESLLGSNASVELLRERSAGYGGIYGQARDLIKHDAQVDFRRIEAVDLKEPWYRGRAIIIGDAAHACPPLIAQGAAMCAEDAVVLADELFKNDSIDAALESFMARRLPRVRMVLENSLLLGVWDVNPGTPDANPGKVMGMTLGMLASSPA
jgi:2-polyprenyl-6-methoxyphenol hydroxylase-like FAD-dependent oxidoreductase